MGEHRDAPPSPTPIIQADSHPLREAQRKAATNVAAINPMGTRRVPAARGQHLQPRHGSTPAPGTPTPLLGGCVVANSTGEGRGGIEGVLGGFQGRGRGGGSRGDVGGFGRQRVRAGKQAEKGDGGGPGRIRREVNRVGLGWGASAGRADGDGAGSGLGELRDPARAGGHPRGPEGLRVSPPTLPTAPLTPQRRARTGLGAVGPPLTCCALLRGAGARPERDGTGRDGPGRDGAGPEGRTAAAPPRASAPRPRAAAPPHGSRCGSGAVGRGTERSVPPPPPGAATATRGRPTAPRSGRAPRGREGRNARSRPHGGPLPRR